MRRYAFCVIGIQRYWRALLNNPTADPPLPPAGGMQEARDSEFCDVQLAREFFFSLIRTGGSLSDVRRTLEEVEHQVRQYVRVEDLQEANTHD